MTESDDNNNCSLIFFVNGKKRTELNPDPECTLLTYLRDTLKLCGTKLACGEGGCGACTVMQSKIDRQSNKLKHLAINACITPLCSVHGTSITTVEGIGSTRTRLHPVQERIAKAHGSQCGFCTPGIVMSMYALLRSMPKPSIKDMEVAFQGNLCRCTGYRPIIEGYKTLLNEYECGMGEKCCKLGGKSCNPNVDYKLFEPSEFSPYHSSQEHIFMPELQLMDSFDKSLLVFRGPRVTWYRPTALSELLSLKAKYPDARILAGNTEVGIEVKFKNLLYPTLIQSTQIKEMNSIELHPTGLKIGASATLSEVEEALLNQINASPSYETRIYKQIVEMLKYFAGKQIRNVASFGGNIMTGSPISDLNPILMAAEVELEVMSLRGARKVRMDNAFYTEYRKNIIAPDEVIVSLTLPKTHRNQYFTAYKQAKRRDDDIAIVNIAMNVVFLPNTDIVDNILIAYGGMASTTVVATKTCKSIIGQPWSHVLVEKAMTLLNEEINLPSNAPGGEVQYRKCLSLSLFFKGYLAIAEELDENLGRPATIKEIDRSGATGLHISEPKSSQLFEKPLKSQPQLDPIGRPIVHLSAYKQATGEAIYCDDIPKCENELYLALVFSSRPHAKILSIDESEALKMEGVQAFFSAKDLEDHQNRFGYVQPDEDIFAKSKVMCKGQIIGAIVADNQALAQRAARMVKVEYEDLSPVIVTIEDAIKHKSYFSDSPISINKGNVDEAFKTSEHIVSGSCRLGGQDHFYLETQVTLAMPRDSDEIEIYSACQSTAHLQKEISNMLSLPESKIMIKVKRIGGGFGGKECRNILVGLPVALAAYKLKCPVRCMLDRNEDMLITGGRHPFFIKYKAGCTKEGLITALDLECYANGGSTLDISLLVIESFLTRIDNAYCIPNIRALGWACKTNLASNTACRATGGPQASFTMENIIRDIAYVTKKDHVDVAFLNLYKDGDITHYNQRIENCTLRRSWKECLVQSNYEEQCKEIEAFNNSNRYKKRGIAIVPTKHGIIEAPAIGKASALVHIYQDGSVLLLHGGIEMGQGLHTKMIQIASRVLNIPHELIHTSQTSTETTANLCATAASLGSDLNGMAVLDACNKLNHRLAPLKEKYPNSDWKTLINHAFYERVCLSATGYYRGEGEGYDFKTQSGSPFLYFTTGVGCSTVEVDCLTGDHQILKTDIVMDVGSSLNPAIDIGQIEGAFMQGYGYFTLEEMIYSPKGGTYSLGPGAYKIPAFSNIPREFNVSILTGASNPRAIYSSKAIGEPPLFLSASVFFAIKEAIRSYRKQNGLSTNFSLISPATSARIRMACEDEFCKKVTTKANDDTVEPWNILP